MDGALGGGRGGPEGSDRMAAARVGEHRVDDQTTGQSEGARQGHARSLRSGRVVSVRTGQSRAGASTLGAGLVSAGTLLSARVLLAEGAAGSTGAGLLSVGALGSTGAAFSAGRSSQQAPCCLTVALVSDGAALSELASPPGGCGARRGRVAVGRGGLALLGTALARRAGLPLLTRLALGTLAPAGTVAAALGRAGRAVTGEVAQRDRHVHGAGQGVLLHEQLELGDLRDAGRGELALGLRAQLGQAGQPALRGVAGWVSSTACAMQEAVPATAVTASRARARSARHGAQKVVMGDNGTGPALRRTPKGDIS